MATAYASMWEKLNLDLDAHAGLLEVLGKFYGDIYLSQSGRLRGMEYLDFVLSEVHGLRIKERQDGRMVIGPFYSMEDMEQLKTRVEAFVEMVR